MLKRQGGLYWGFAAGREGRGPAGAKVSLGTPPMSSSMHGSSMKRAYDSIVKEQKDHRQC
jgi:hypothetical protein